MELYRALGTLIEAPSPEHARVAAALGADGGRAHVAGQDARVIRQGKEAPGDGPHERVQICVGEVRPPDAAGEQAVATKKNGAFRLIESDVVRGMPWRVDGPQLDAGQAAGFILVCQTTVRDGQGREKLLQGGIMNTPGLQTW